MPNNPFDVKIHFTCHSGIINSIFRSRIFLKMIQGPPLFQLSSWFNHLTYQPFLTQNNVFDVADCNTSSIYLGTFGPTTLRTNDSSDQRLFGPTTLRTNDSSNQRLFGPTTLRTNNSSDQRFFGTKTLRTNNMDPSERWLRWVYDLFVTFFISQI